MLDKTSEKILKYVISKFDGNAEADIYVSPSDLELDYTVINLLCKEMRKNEYISIYSPASSNQDPAHLRLTGKGLKYFELNRKNNLYILRNSIIIPIIVTIATQLILFLLKQLWLLILR